MSERVFWQQLAGGSVDVIHGPTALRVGRYWVGVASGNRYAQSRRRTSDAALRDAQRLELRETPAERVGRQATEWWAGDGPFDALGPVRG